MVLEVVEETAAIAVVLPEEVGSTEMVLRDPTVREVRPSRMEGLVVLLAAMPSATVDSVVVLPPTETPEEEEEEEVTLGVQEVSMTDLPVTVEVEVLTTTEPTK
ncbi:MAG: hypothetical protein EBV59_09215 [Synechococcaceae bacterium WB7_1C_051]|nr:hypothetical protein [Synechococcaceae bacterium WB7_1C_051]